MRQNGFGEQPGLFAAPRRLFTCTPSKIATFEDCPRRYRHTYVDRPAPRKGPPWAHNSLGISLHAALRGWYARTGPQRQQLTAATLLRSAWVTEGYRDDTQAAAMFRMAVGWLESYLARLDPAEEPVGVERVVAAKTRTLALSGRIDRIDQRGEALTIVDYKTGRVPSTVDDARGSRALALYAFAAARVFRMPCWTVELHHLPSGSVAAHEHTEESLARHLARAEQTAAEAIDAETEVERGADPDTAFPTQAGPRCSWCDYRRICPVGLDHRARDPWAGVEGRADGGSGR